jgi:glyoxylase-like metal-dependent hydrolase (beta-lactamase superfamily II)
LDVIATPGHSPGGICFYNAEEQILISGDTLFESSVGRTDLAGGNYQSLLRSIKEKLCVLPDSTQVYPGHGGTTTIGHEKLYNPYL